KNGHHRPGGRFGRIRSGVDEVSERDCQLLGRGPSDEGAIGLDHRPARSLERPLVVAGAARNRQRDPLEPRLVRPDLLLDGQHLRNAADLALEVVAQTAKEGGLGLGRGARRSCIAHRPTTRISRGNRVSRSTRPWAGSYVTRSSMRTPVSPSTYTPGSTLNTVGLGSGVSGDRLPRLGCSWTARPMPWPVPWPNRSPCPASSMTLRAIPSASRPVMGRPSFAASVSAPIAAAWASATSR